MMILGTKTDATKYSQGKQLRSKLLLNPRQKSFGVAKGFGFAFFHFGGPRAGAEGNHAWADTTRMRQIRPKSAKS